MFACSLLSTLNVILRKVTTLISLSKNNTHIIMGRGYVTYNKNLIGLM